MKYCTALLLGCAVILAGTASVFPQNDKQPQKATSLELKGGKASVTASLTKDDPKDNGKPNNAHKLYSVRLEKDKTYRIDLMSTDFDSYLRLEDASGKELARDDDGGGGNNARIAFSCPATSDYRIVATTLGSLGLFILSVEEHSLIRGTPLELKAGKGRVETKLTTDDPKDRGQACKIYEVKLETRRTYKIDQMSKDFDSFLRLEDASGKQLAADDDGGSGNDSRISFTCPASGSYRIIATTIGQIGAFVLTVEEFATTTATEIAMKDGKGRVDARLTNDDPRDHRNLKFPCKTYDVRLQAGRRYRIDLMSREFDCFLRLEDQSGKELAKDDDGGGSLNSRITFSCTNTATYRLVATTVEGMGAFTLTIADAVSVSPNRLNFEARSEGTLAADDPKDKTGYIYRPYTVRLEAGCQYRMDLTSSTFDAYLRLEDSEGKEVAKDDNSGGSLNARIFFLSKTSGNYRVYASSKARGGNFTLVISQLEVATPVPLAMKSGLGKVESKLTEQDPGDHASKTLYCKVFAVQLEAGQVYRIDQTSKDFDSLLRLEDPSGKQLAQDDDGGGELNSRITFLCRRTDTYRVVSTAIGLRGLGRFGLFDNDGTRGATGTFVLNIAAQEALKPVTLEPRSAAAKVEGQLNKDSMRFTDKPARVYSMRLEEGQTYRLDMSSKQFDGALRLENEDGEIVAQDDDGGEGLDSRLTFRCPRAGTYYLLATTNATPVKYGSYSLAVALSDAKEDKSKKDKSDKR